LRLFLLRLLSFALPFALVIGGVWLLPMVNGKQVTTTSIGPPRAWGIDERAPFDQTVTWKTTVEITAEPTYVLPRLPFRFDSSGGSKPGGTTLYLDQRVFINNQFAYRYGTGWGMGSPGGGSGGGIVEGKPDDIGEVNESLLHRGTNVIEVRAHVWRSQGSNTATGHYALTIGPVNVQVIRADLDHDGVRDDKQPFAVHTGAVAVPLALASGGVGLFIVNRRQRKK
jgi:hypothetical protein